MSELPELRDVQPLTLAMVGGPQDGTVVTVTEPRPPSAYQFAEQLPLDVAAMWTEPEKPPPLPRCHTYRATGNVRDDGACVYSYAGTA